MELFARPIVAIVFGAFIVCAETCLHFDSLAAGNWLDMPWHDWIAGVWLTIAGMRNHHPSQVRLAAPWAFMLSLLVGALFGLWGQWPTAVQPSEEWLSAATLLWIVTALSTIALVALLETLKPQRRPAT